MLGILEDTLAILASSGYKPSKLTAYAHAAIAVAHITGFEPLYDYPVEVYYELMDIAEESALYTPRWLPDYQRLAEEVEALAAFEETLADSKTVFHAEPILAAAALGFGCRLKVSKGWRTKGFTPEPGQQVVIVVRRGRKHKVQVPRSLYTLAVAGLAFYNPDCTAEEFIAVLPDPAVIRREVFESRVAYEEASRILRSIVERHVREICVRRGEGYVWACNSDDKLVIKYEVKGPSLLRVEYLECST
jgi:hypothetical protein